MRALDPRLLRRLRGARVALALDVFLGLLSTIALLAQAVVFARIVADAFEGGSLVPGRIALLASITVVRSALVGGFEAAGRLAAGRVMSTLRSTLVERRLREAPLAADGAEAAEVATAAVQGVDALETYFARYLPQVVLAMLVPTVVLVWSATIDPTSAAIMLLTLPLIPMFMMLIGRFAEARSRARWQALSRLSSHFLDVVRGLPTLRAFNRAEAQAEQIEASAEAYRVATMQVLRVSFLSGAVLDLMATLAIALVAVTLGIRLIAGDVGLEAALTVLLLTPELYAPIRALAAQFHASADGLAAAERILDLIDVPGTAVGADQPPPSWRTLRLQGVSLTFAGRPDRLLDGFDLEIRRGEIVALVGMSGAGKSTVGLLLLGLRSPDSGTITVDGADLASMDLRAWRKEVAWLPQRPTLFRGSVRHNIAMGDPSASGSRIEEAASLAGADAFIRELRHGYDTRIGDGGRALSAGETRRIALARALAREAPLLILDEPTSNLDARTSEEVMRSIERVSPDRAVLLIEHKLERVAFADRIIRIEDGRAAEALGAVR